MTKVIAYTAHFSPKSKILIDKFEQWSSGKVRKTTRYRVLFLLLLISKV